MSNINRIFLLSTNSNDTEELNFKPIFSLSPQYVNQAINMSQVFQDAIVSTTIEGNQCLKFDFNKAIDIIKKHSEMAVVGIINQTISQTSEEASVMVDKIVDLLKNILMITLTDKQKEDYGEIISNAFTNLKTQKEDAWIFWQHQESHKTTYQYNVYFAIQNEETGSVMLGLPLSLTIEVDIDKEHVLGIKIKDKHNYSVNVQAIQVVEALQN